MAVAVRSFTSTAYASRTNTTLTAPSGLADGDILLAAVFVGASGTAPSVATPPGFTALTGSPTSVIDAGGFNGKLNVFWKRAASESGSYTFSHSSASSQGLLLAISGAVTSGSPIDASSNNTGTGYTSTATGVTTTVPNDLLLYIAHDWEGGGALSPPSGFTEIFDSLIYSARMSQATSGGSGSKTQTNGNIDKDSPWAAWLVAIAPSAGAGSQTLTPSKFTNTNTFYAPTVSRGARTLTPSLFANTNTFYAPLIRPRNALTPAKYTDADSFYAATVARGTRTLSPSLYANPDTFYSATVGRGAVTLRPSLVSDGDTFYSPTVTQGPVTLRPGLFTDADAFFAPVVGRGSVTLHPTKYADPDTFYSAFIGAGQPLQPAKFINTNSFLAPVVARGSVSLTPSKYSNSNSFYGPTVRSVHALLPSLFSDSDIFYAPTISGGATGLEPGFFANQNAFFAALIRQAAGFVTNPLERLKMYTGSMGSVSNREDWIVNISLVGDDGTSFDLTGAEIVAYVCREGCSNNPVLSASLGNGIVLTDNYTMQWHFDESQMASLCPQQYGVFCRVERDGITTQLLSANIAIVEGGPA